MKIAVATNGNTLEDRVSNEFESSTHLLVVETEDRSFEVYQNDIRSCKTGLEMAKIIKECDCEAVITGSIGQVAFEEIADAQITRYMGAGLIAKDALNMMENYQLSIISEYKGGEGLFHIHTHNGSCNCSEED
jgi:predicted Fe-Mo cluster-binding NifX family protein